MDKDGPKLVIRAAQLAVFEREAVIDAVLRGHRAEAEAAGIDAFCARVEAALARAAELGIEAPVDQGRFAELRLQLGDDLEQRPWARAILGWDRPAAQKLAQLEARAQREALKQAGWSG
ncbi:MAG: hypothetical protein AB7N76_03550 [Planctomycetota bacterium]